MKTNYLLIRIGFLVLWSFFSVATVFSQTTDTASPDNPLDLTDLITNPSFESSFTGWTNKGLASQTNTSFPQKEGDTYIEKWVNFGSKVPNVSVQQLVSNLPKGNYTLTVAAGHIQQSDEGDTTAQTGASIFVEAKNVAVDTFQDYSIDFIAMDGQVTIGFKTENATGNWVTCDNFRLQYKGITIADLKNHLQTEVDTANVLLKSEMADSVRSKLLAAISSAEQAILDQDATKEALTDIVALIENANAEANSSIFDYKLNAASPENPLDMTYLVVNQSFESSFEGWTYRGLVAQTNSSFPLKKGYIYLEKWVNRGSNVPDVFVQQLIADMPNGNYKMIVSAGNIQQSENGSTVNNSPTPQTGAFIFAGKNETAVDTFEDHSVNFTVVDKQVNIGFKTEGATGNWVTCDNFRLQYIGKYNEDDYALYLEDFVNEANSMLSLKVTNAFKDSLTAAISIAQDAISANPKNYTDLEEAKAALYNAISYANTSIQAYDGLKERIDYATNLIGWYPDDQTKKDKLQPAIDAAKADYDNLDLTVSEINQSIADLKTVIKGEDKKIYIPTWIMGDVNDKDNNWSYTRSRESKNWILFWEPGFGANPGTTVDECLALADKCFNYYADSLKFITKGSSKTDTCKMIIRLRFSTGWEASGSGVDNLIGLLTLTPSALSSRGGQTIAHEVGHCFQYQVHCDNDDSNGWKYGFGENASGGNGWWEQCAQWQAYKVFPTMQFNNEWFSGYMNNVHKHIIHESPRYTNFFIQDYWTNLHGLDFIGRLWNESVKPEDPVEAYIRITDISQSQFNDEMYDCAAKFTTWDISSLKSYGADKITSRPQPKMNDVGNDYWMIDSTVCPENYGHNIIKVNIPETGGETVTANFEGKAGAVGYRSNYSDEAGWRIGFVALKSDGTRIYGDMKSVTMTQDEGKTSVSFVCPADCIGLWFVVSGAPSSHWRHAWDGDDSNDEQWPYQVKFNNTNLVGHPNVVIQPSEVTAITSSIPEIRAYSNGNRLLIEDIPFDAQINIYNMVGICVVSKNVSDNTYSVNLKSGVYIITAHTEKGIWTKKVIIK